MSDIMKPMDIERRSFEIIDERLGHRVFGHGTDDIIKRVIHTTADFEYAESLVFSDGVVETVLAALRRGAAIVTDTNMAMSGINKKIVTQLGGSVRCFMSDRDVAAEAKKRGITRAAVSMEKACGVPGDVIFAIGNAPTALIAIDRLIKEGRLAPCAVIGVPVGFVNVAEAKDLILQSDVPHIVARGNKGGSAVAAAIMNALIYKIRR